ncbi:MAG: plastocyanin/azurin family copper-binding protein [Halobacteriales archaeon]|nr:plastocyanin/azurin family copper-binding protein [Halobacteriales archaeon]
MTDNGTTRRGFLRGAAGTAALAGATGGAAAQEGGTLQIDLVDFAFEPGTDDPAQITPGTTVDFVWQTPSHNINLTSKPEASEWEGHMPIENTGFETSHTFEVEGTYEFHCDPHKGLGMEGSIEVTPDAGGGGEGGDGGGAPSIPDAAKTVGVGLFGAMMATLGLAYFLLKYGGSPTDEE